MCVDGYRYDSYKSKFFLFLAFLTVLQIVIVILFNFIFGKSCFISVGSVYINLYHLHLIPHLQGQALQYHSVMMFASVLHWGICGLLCGWPVWAESQMWDSHIYYVYNLPTNYVWGVAMRFPEWFYWKPHTRIFNGLLRGVTYEVLPWAAMHLAQ
jgi:hypothetical protein